MAVHLDVWVHTESYAIMLCMQCNYAMYVVT
jgi:hypothetical protein